MESSSYDPSVADPTAVPVEQQEDRTDQPAPAEGTARVGNPEDDRFLDFYCPQCGRQAKREGICVGSDLAPHPPQEVVSTDELKGEPKDKGSDEHRKWRENHTPAPPSPGV